MLKTVDVTYLSACVSFGRTEPFEELHVAVSATAELCDFFCNFCHRAVV